MNASPNDLLYRLLYESLETLKIDVSSWNLHNERGNFNI